MKFLPESLEGDPARLAQLHNEVRLARQIAHKNVCRVYDIGDADGQPFLTMEYVDGEDLASLLRRIGRVPEDKGLELARQLCAGLAAAHERGVLHRDLKPAYMAPEQLAGKPATTRSDVYASLGSCSTKSSPAAACSLLRLRRADPTAATVRHRGRSADCR
jgi:serine/threonine protein kinase